MKLLIGSSNKGKFIEVSDSLRGLEIDLVSPSDAGITESPVETGDTFPQNAGQKASFYYSLSQLPTLADDSGILVEALKDELGIHTRRWGAGPEATDAEWVEYFLDRMKHEENRRARFVCCLCFIDENGTKYFFEGSCDGVITETLEAEYLPGLPISACFKPNGFDKVYSALSVQEKNDISHRGLALTGFRAFMQDKLLTAD